MIEGLFLVSVAFVLYTFMGYPLVIAVMSSGKVDAPPTSSLVPPVSIIVAVHNEETTIAPKLDNLLTLQYPAGRLEILIASDQSTDRTDERVRAYATKGIALVPLTTRGGKVAAQQRAVEHAKGEIIVFSDASTRLEADIIPKLVRPFADPLVGCVSAEDRSVSSTDLGRVEDEGLYVRYEMFIRRAESRLGVLVGASGCCFAIRRALWRTFDRALSEDFMLPLMVAEQGYKTVNVPDAIAYVPTLPSLGREFTRRVRTATQGLMTLVQMRRLLNPWAFGGVAFALISHKLCRFLVQFFLIAGLLSNMALARGTWLYSLTLGVQVLFYGAALIGWGWGRNAPRAFSFPAYLVTVQCAVVAAWLCLGVNRRFATWSPSRRCSSLESK